MQAPWPPGQCSDSRTHRMGGSQFPLRGSGSTGMFCRFVAEGAYSPGKTSLQEKWPSAETRCSNSTSWIIVPSRIEIAWILSFLTVLLFDME